MLAELVITVVGTYMAYYLVDITNYMEHRYKRWRKFNSLVLRDTTTTLEIYMLGARLMARTLYVYAIQYLTRSTNKIDKNTYEIQYVINNKLYRMIKVPNKGPCPIVSVHDEHGTDMTRVLLMYYGPNHDWHGVPLYPKFFNRSNLVFDMINGDQLIFEELDDIVLPSVRVTHAKETKN
jgi:hypothetical protein